MRRAVLPGVGIACLLGLVLACFGPVLFRGEQFAFRDAAHFYYPLYQRVQQEWEAGRWPLWEPEENGGMPLLGNPTAAVLYPGKLLFAIVPYAWGARLYIIAHTVLAAGAMYALVRSWEIGRAGSAISALSFGFGAPILFQYCNVVFLVGAAWAPLGLRGADRWLRLGRRWGMVELALVLAMQTLGGDPESAYVTGLCAIGYALGLAWSQADRGRPSSRKVGGWFLAVGLLIVPVLVGLLLPGRPGPLLLAWLVVGLAGLAWLFVGRGHVGWRLVGMLAGLAGSAALALAISSAQLLPVLEYTGLSSRMVEQGPHDIYPFSLEPYRVVELAWPNVFGTTFVDDRYWLEVIPPIGKHRVWVPSLYLGGLTMILAFGAAGFRGGPPWRAWLTAIALVSLLASFGEFGSPLWWARWVPSWQPLLGVHDPIDVGRSRFDGYPRDGDGGFYWLLATVLPAFRSFRFPSKFLTFTALALSGLAGFGWERVAAGRSRRFARWALAWLALTLGLLAASALFRARIMATFEGGRAIRFRTIYGPFLPREAFAGLQGALVQGSLAIGSTVLVVLLARRSPRRAGALALVVLAADLAHANARHVLTVPQAVFEEKPHALIAIEAAERDAAARERRAPTPYRIHRMRGWHPLAWLKERSAGRNREIVAWERATLQAKYGLPFGACYTLTEGTAELYDYDWFFAPAAVNPRVGRVVPPGQEKVYYPRRGFDIWNTRYFILPAIPHDDESRGIWSFLPRTEPIEPGQGAFRGQGGRERRARWDETRDYLILRNRAALPRAWVVHSARYVKPIVGLDRADRQAIMGDILYPGDEFWTVSGRKVIDPRVVAWIEIDDSSQLAAFLKGSRPDPSDRVMIATYEPQRVELIADLKSPGIVILADVFDPGWRLAIDGAEAPILRANRLMRGAAVPAGRRRLVYTYQPRSFRVGGWISLAGIVGLCVLSLSAKRWPLAKDR